MSRSRSWCFTINNPTDDDKKTCDNIVCNYIVTGNEVGENGTPHIQGYLELKDGKSMKAMKKLLGDRAHLEARKGTPKQAADYCKKDGNFTERGKITEQGKRNDLDDIAELVKTGGTQAVIEAKPSAFLKFGRNIERMSELLMKPRTKKPSVVWLWGTTGTGKTRYATNNNTGDYYIWNGTKWWNGYRQQTRVVLDDYSFDGSDAGFRYLLRLLDTYAIQVETKGGMIHFNSPEIYITCEYPPNHIFTPGNQLNQVLRRIDLVKEMKFEAIYSDELESITEEPEDNISDEDDDEDELEDDPVDYSEFDNFDDDS